MPFAMLQRNCRGSCNPTQGIKFRVEDRIECMQSHKVKYTYRDEYMLAVPIPVEAAVNKGGYSLCCALILLSAMLKTHLAWKFC
jgi:uncharacterized UBP type Zn finger protein